MTNKIIESRGFSWKDNTIVYVVTYWKVMNSPTVVCFNNLQSAKSYKFDLEKKNYHVSMDICRVYRDYRGFIEENIDDKKKK